MRSVDLRVAPVDAAVDRVQNALQVQLDRTALVRKRRSLGAPTDRGTWVRIERRPFDKIDGQAWNGTESAAALTGVAKPDWFSGVAWRDEREPVVWRADETTLLPSDPIGTAVLGKDPQLPDRWWKAFNASLDALALARTTRIATPDTELVTEDLVARTVTRAFAAVVDCHFSVWAPAHADLNWANMTGPEFCLFDWEDWGNAPQGLDAASLWTASLAVPALAERVRRERDADLSSRDGRLMMLFALAKFAGPDAHPADPRVLPGRAEASRLIAELISR